MPALQLKVNPIGHGQHFAVGIEKRARAQSGRNQMADDFGVKSIASQRQPFVA